MTETSAKGTFSANTLDGFQVPHGVLKGLENRRDALLGFFQEVFEIQKNLLTTVSVDEGGGYPCFSRATCSANSMDWERRCVSRPVICERTGRRTVVIDFLGHIVIDHMLDFVEIKAFGGYICRDKNIGFAILEAFYGEFTLLLGYKKQKLETSEKKEITYSSRRE